MAREETNTGKKVQSEKSTSCVPLLFPLDRLCEYLKKNKHRMRYDEYLKAGYPIATGVIEGACRHVIKDRMERTGMRWKVPGAQAMLQLRVIRTHGDWQVFQEYRIKQETLRLYPHVNATENIPWPIAA